MTLEEQLKEMTHKKNLLEVELFKQKMNYRDIVWELEQKIKTYETGAVCVIHGEMQNFFKDDVSINLTADQANVLYTLVWNSMDDYRGKYPCITMGKDTGITDQEKMIIRAIGNIVHELGQKISEAN